MAHRTRDPHADPSRIPSGATEEPSPRGLLPVPEFDEDRFRLQFGDAPPEPGSRADRRGTRRKLAAGLRGLKAAVRGDSSFYAHAYRGMMVAIVAAILRVSYWSWCLLVLAGGLVLVAELGHSAVDTLARAVGDPDEPRLTVAREIAAAAVLVAVLAAVAVAAIVFTVQSIDLFDAR